MKELPPEQKNILKSLTNEAFDENGFLVYGRVTRAYRSMPNTRLFPDFGEPNPNWPLEEFERRGLIEAIPIQGTDEIEWTITPSGAAVIGKKLIGEKSRL